VRLVGHAVIDTGDAGLQRRHAARTCRSVSNPVRPSASASLAGLKDEGRDAHADQVGAMDTLKTLGQNHANTPSSLGPLAAQSRLDPMP
jgi:hypothetical protein